jgi:23S rRNA (guanosine2251-2'-O)-methyltransferase
MDANEQSAFLEGGISVEAALKADRRKIEAVLIKQGKKDRTTDRIRSLAKSAGVPVTTVSAEEIEKHSSGRSHGGIGAIVGERSFQPMTDLVNSAQTPFVIMCDGIEDPFNFGSALRSLYAAGASGVVLPPRNWMSAAGVVARSSAGASELLDIAIAQSADEAAEKFRQNGLTIACTGERGSTSLYDTDLTVPLFLLIGGERRGVTRSFMSKADLIVHVPYAKRFNAALSTSSAAAVIAFEVMRQRLSAPGPSAA